MGNERLRSAIAQAGLDTDQLATLVEVDVKSVQRWIAGAAIPYPRHRTRIATALGRAEQELWPDATPAPPEPDARREILAAYPHSNDLRAPDWRVLLRDATQQVDLLSYSLIEILSTPGAPETLAAKGAAGCRVRILIADPESVFVTSAAVQLGQADEDYVSRNELQREIEQARGYLEPLLQRPGIEAYSFLAERYNTILRFDQQMLVTLNLWGTTRAQAPMLHLRRTVDDGLFDQLAAHLEAILEHASEPIEPNPEHYPHPAQNAERYQPISQARHDQLIAALRHEAAG
jgi:transcriptional regulator with XRE-family HTH domain